METSNFRQPLAVVFCDIAGTSRLMAHEGDLVTSTVLHDFFEYSGRLSKEHACTFIKFIGDGFLAAFANVGDCLCIETSYWKDVFGDSINLVAHLNDLAQPGQIVISQAALDRMPAEQQALAAPGDGPDQIRRRGSDPSYRPGGA